MSPRLCFFVLLCVLPVLVRGRGGGGRGGGGRGHGSRGGYGHSSHTYPSNNGGLSGAGHSTHQEASYPHSNTGLSGNNGPKNYRTHHRTEHHHYYYSPPSHINYGHGYHPVYQGSPPVYVYTYRNSGSRYDSLLTGLALYNLGRMSSHNDHYNSYYGSSQHSYRGTPGEVCKFQIIKTNGEYEEANIGCQLMSSFIWDVEREKEQERNRVVSNTNTITTVNVTTVEHSNDNNSSFVTTTVQNSTVVSALEAKGPSIQVTPGMECFMIHVYRDSKTKKKVDCGLLQQYASSSFKNNSSRNLPVMSIVILLSSVFLL